MIELEPIKVVLSEKLTLQQIEQLASEFDIDVEKEFRKGSTFYANCFVEINQDMVDYAKNFFGVDIIDQIGLGYALNGMWSDDNGCDWYGLDVYQSEDVYIPEKVIIEPARLEKKWKQYAF